MTTTLSLQSTVAASKEQVSCGLGDEVVLLSLKRGVYYGLDPVGSRVWQLLETPQTVAALRDAILEEYDVTPERCEEDLFALLRHLAEEELIEVRDGAAA